MTTAELKEYLGMVVQTEKEVNLQEQLCQQIKQKIDGYEHSINYLKRSIAVIVETEKPIQKNKNRGEKKIEIAAGPVLLLVTVTSYGLWKLLDSSGIDGLVLALEIVLAIISGLSGLGTVIGMILSVWALITYPDALMADRAQYKEEMQRYQEKCQKNEKMKKDNKENQGKIEKLKFQKYVAESYLQQIQKALASSHENLEQMYAYNVVFPKYRNYVMISSIYEYICAGRCTTLEGHEGAYNILELEIRLDRIITQLDAVLRDLSAIRANQYTLYSCLQEANQKIDTLLQEESRMADSMQALGAQSYEINRQLGELQHSSELANYLAECNQRELHYMNRMNYLAGHYDNPYGNYTPV